MNSLMYTGIKKAEEQEAIPRSVLYTEFVYDLIKKYPDTPDMEFCHAAMGVTGEAGELCDALKKIAIYGNEPDRENIIEELGDLNFFMTDIQNKFNISDEEIIEANVKKLQKRYPKGYSNQAAQERADKIISTLELVSKYSPKAGDMP